MIVDLPTTNSSKINKALVDMREQGGSVALGRVLTLVIVTDEANAEDPIAAANAASFEHPCRVIVVALGSKRASPRMDAQIRVGGDAGASEVVVLRLYGVLVDHGASVVVPLLLADAPVVVWWPGEAPEIPAEDPIGMLAQRRITDASSSKRPVAQLAKRRETYRPGDTDLSWTRITRWRGLLASTMDQPPHDKVIGATVAGAADSPSADLLAGWLALSLKVPVKRIKSPTTSGPGLHSVVLNRRCGDISLIRPQTITAELKVANQPERQVALPRRGLRDCLSEELRRLDADDVYAEVLTKGMALVAKQAEADAKAPAKAAPTKAASTKAAPTKAAPTKAAPTKAAPTKAAPTKAAVAQATPTKTVSVKAAAAVADRKPRSRTAVQPRAVKQSATQAAEPPPEDASSPVVALPPDRPVNTNGGKPARRTRTTSADASTTGAGRVSG